MLKDHFAKAKVNSVGEEETILDSGSGRHIDKRVRVTDPDHSVSLTGFDSSQQWTDGSGFLPMQFDDTLTDEQVKLDIEGVDNLSTVAAPILSLGKLLREGWAFHFEGKDLYALTPGGAHKLQVKLGEDNILRLPHTIRTGKDSEPLPSPGKVSAVRHTIDKATSQLLHDIFNHASMEKIFQTLGVTKGYK